LTISNPLVRDRIAVNIASGYEMDSQGVGVQGLVGVIFSSSPHLPAQFWAHQAYYPICTSDSSFMGKAAMA
jgi:hypothetical protein